MHPFHMAFPVTDLEATRAFYCDLLGCPQGREKPGAWLDFNFFGHQMSAHLKAEALGGKGGDVDGDTVPIPHFGAVLDMKSFEALAKTLSAAPETDWIIEPKTRFSGEPGEQATMFIRDPSGNAIEFKGFADKAAIFAS